MGKKTGPKPGPNPRTFVIVFLVSRQEKEALKLAAAENHGGNVSNMCRSDVFAAHGLPERMEAEIVVQGE